MEAREAFRETVKEKGSARARPNAVAKIHPRKLYMPSDFIDKRTDPSYRNSEVTTYDYYDLERVFERMSLDKVPDWEEFKRLDNEQKKEILVALVRKGLKSGEVAKEFGDNVTSKDILNTLQALGLKMSDIPGSPVYGRSYPSTRKPAQKKNENERQSPMNQGGIMPWDVDLSPRQRRDGKDAGAEKDEQKGAAALTSGIGLSLMSKLTTQELSGKLLALASLLGDNGFANDDVLYEVQLVVRQTTLKVPEEKKPLQQQQNTARNGVQDQTATAQPQTIEHSA